MSSSGWGVKRVVATGGFLLCVYVFVFIFRLCVRTAAVNAANVFQQRAGLFSEAVRLHGVSAAVIEQSEANSVQSLPLLTRKGKLWLFDL